ncbi:hypothetical protein F4778DRAFT_418121 [Xylariomycetidae sp. FL2044]|nr:hypothetical protein F4778DRAFT_418121 [Xylariomycetidae sp. FL2044]
MAEPHSATVSTITLETLQERSSSVRRARPPDITISSDESRIPLRAEGLTKRESRIGLRGIFGRSKTGGKSEKGAQEPSFLRETPRHPGLRASLADIGHWPYRLHSSRSEASLFSPSLSASSSSLAVDHQPLSARSQPSTGNKSKPLPPTPHRTNSIATWNPPPLFQVYPQAVKYATLPSCNASMETLARLSEHRNSLLSLDPSRIDITSGPHEEPGLEKKGEGGKPRHRITRTKNALDWTRKIFVLVTSGYLLQYTAEGAFDRLPEKILQLTKDSAAFASDLIPGRHWVLQVAMVADGNMSADSKSLKSKFLLKGNEKKQVSNMLLVFESADGMDTWLASLRREIESLGGKKKLSETGDEEKTETDATLKAQSSQRTLVTRDPERFSHVFHKEFSWPQESDPSDNELSPPGPVRTSNSTLDDSSTIASSDGQRLDSLRDTGNGNRLSYISSGQRTIVTSAGSSPSSSPIRASFSSQEDHLLGLPEVRLRPNAAAIMSRRQSMQNMAPNLHAETYAHSESTSTPGLTVDHGHQQCVPNFSVPQTSSRRYSALSLSPCECSTEQAEMHEPEHASRPRKSPPTALALSRPLSTVVDQPSPISPRSPMSIPEAMASTIAMQTAEVFGARSSQSPEEHNAKVKASARKANPLVEVPPIRIQAVDTPAPEENARAASALGSYGRSGEPTAASGPKHASYKRSTFIAENLTFQQVRHSFANTAEWTRAEARKSPSPPSSCSPKRSAPSLKTFQQTPSKFLLSVEKPDKGLISRRSMPHLAEGPPPAPPPTRALPPIPRKHSTTPRRVRA